MISRRAAAVPEKPWRTFLGGTIFCLFFFFLSALTHGQEGAPLFPGEKWPVGSRPESVIAGDFNGDGKTDLATANESSNDVSVLLGNGDGSFAAQRRFTVYSLPRSVIAGDFNGDGKTDLATANGNANDVSVLLGNGDGTFAAPRRFAVDSSPWLVVAGDFNGDGKTDLATANGSSSNDVTVLLGDGEGSFAAQRRFMVGSSPSSVIAGDFNGDGKTDLATANGSSNDVSVLLGDGEGSFAAPRRFTVGSNPRSVIAGDFNGDGNTDLATANWGSSDVSVLLNLGGEGSSGADLAIIAVSAAPVSLQPGAPFRLSYEAASQGAALTPLRWLDGVWLSADAQLDSTDTFLGWVPREGGATANGRYTASVDLALPSYTALRGAAYIVVRADAGSDIEESNEGNNTATAAVVISQQIATLELSQPYSGSLRAGEALFFAVNPVAGEPFSITLTGLPTDGSMALYLKHGALPSRTDYDRAATASFTTGHYLYLPAGKEGSYYIMVEARTLASSPATFQLTASNPAFDVRPAPRFGGGGFGTGGNAGNYTVRAFGNRLDPTTSARLVAGQGFDRAAILNYYESESEFYATFDLRGIPPGTYDVLFANAKGESVLVPQSLAVVEAPEPLPVIPRLIAPSAIRRDRDYSFTVEWENTSSLNDAVAPVLTVSNTVPFGLAYGDESLGSRYTFLGINSRGGPPGILRPGQWEGISFYAKSGTEDGDYVASVDRLVKEPETAFDWAEAVRPFRPEAMTEAQAAALAAELGAAYGPTQGGYLRALASFANAEWEKINNPEELLHHEVLRAWSRLASGVWGTVSGMNPPPDGHAVRLVGAEGNATRATRTDRLGRFHFSDLADGSYHLTVERAMLTTPAQGNVVVAGGRSAGPVALAVTPASQFAVQIDVRDGTPMANAVVIPSRGEMTFDAALTDFAGLATFYGLEPGTYDLTATDGEGEIRKAKGVVVTANPPALTRLDLAQATVRGTLPPGENWHPVLVPVADGEFEFIPAKIEQNQFTIQAPAGHYKLMVFDETGTPIRQGGPWQITPGADIDAGLLGVTGALSVFRSPRDDGQVKWFTDPGVREHLSGLLNPIAMDLITYYCGRDPARVKDALTPFILYGVRSQRGSEYEGVVRNYLFRGRSLRWVFLDDTETVEGYMGLLADNPGFRKNTVTARWLRDLVKGSEFYLKEAIENGTYALEPDHSMTIDIVGSKFQSLVRDNYTKALFFNDYHNNSQNWMNFTNTLAGGVGQYGTPPGPLYDDARRIVGGIIELSRDCDGIYTAKLRDVGFHVHDAFDIWPGNLAISPETTYATTILAFLEINNQAWDQVLDIVWTNRKTIPLGLGDLGRKECGETCDDPDGSECIERPRSWDPNDIIGPAGVGPQHHVFADAVMPYMIRFENHATQASAPAAMVTITQKLDADLDWTTLRLGNIGFGDTVVSVPLDAVFHETRVDLRETRGVYVDIKAGLNIATGEVNWEFVAIDPATGGLPEDPRIGFLPPNASAPEGEGFVTYTIHPKRPAASGTRIDAVASIVFDVNEPIITPAIFHTLDDGPPDVLLDFAHKGVGGTNVEVYWLGDDHGGAGIASYDVAVSLDGGPFTPWLTKTAQTQAMYTGYFGQDLQFRVTARDLLGQRSPAPAMVATTIIADDYLHWRSEKFGAAVGDPALRNTLWGDEADPDGDGRSNLAEFLAAADPQAADAQFNPTTRTEGGSLIYSYRLTKVANHLVDHWIEWSPDGVHWFTGGVTFRVASETAEYRQMEAVLALNGQAGVQIRQGMRRAVVFSHWIYEEGAPAGQRGPNDDPNGDGIANAMAYALGTPAMGPLPASDRRRLPQGVVESDVEVPRAGIGFETPEAMREDATLFFEVSPSLKPGSWTEAGRRTASGGWTFRDVGRWQVKTAGGAPGMAATAITEEPSGQGFYRLRAVVNP